MDEIGILTNKIAREKVARKEAEAILERKSAELFLTNEKLQQLAHSLKEREEKTRAILEATADGLIVLNENHHVQICNNAACDLFEYTPKEINTKHFRELFLNSDGMSEGSDKCLQSPDLPNSKCYIIELFAVTKTNMTWPVEVAISHLDFSDGKYIICTIRNIFKRKQAELYLTLQHKVTKALASSSSLEEACFTTLDIFCRTLRAEAGDIWKVNVEHGLFELVNIWSLSEEYRDFLKLSKNMVMKLDEGLPGLTLKNKKPYWITDLLLNEHFVRKCSAEKANLHSGLAIPIIYDKEVIGVLEVFMRRSADIDENLQRVLFDVSDQLGIFIERDRIQRNLLEAQRLAGMTEVATSVLHNVGNVLNSVNVSIHFLSQKIKSSKLDELKKVAELLSNPSHPIVKLLNKDPKGKTFIKYLISLNSTWEEEQAIKLNEINILTGNVQHINSIIKSQQNTGSSFSVLEKIYIDKLLNEALEIHSYLYKLHNITCVKEYAEIGPFLVDKVKLMQIIINLIRNALDSIMSQSDNIKKITLKTELIANTLIIQISDTGQGIIKDHLVKIFSYGFTTKKDGHGFGLHASALAAKQMGGKLKAESMGVGEGATFTLELPYNVTGE